MTGRSGDPGRYILAGDYSISRIIHGGWQFSAGHRLSAAGSDDAREVLVRAADLGGTTFDCADIYTGVEELYGQFIRRWKSTSNAAPLQIHTKFVPDYGDLGRVDRAYVERIIDRSLTRLGIDRLDLVQVLLGGVNIGVTQAPLHGSQIRDSQKLRRVRMAQRVERDRGIQLQRRDEPLESPGQ